MSDITLGNITVPANSRAKSASGLANTDKLDIPATITQIERLYTARSRNVNHRDGGGDRGERAYIKLLTSDPKSSMDRHGDHVSSKPTSLTTGENVLNQAINGNGYASFLITDIQCGLDEKIQVVETFGDAEVAYFFGRQPIRFQFGGVLVDSVDNNWFVQWLEMYSNVLRGTQLARNYELVKIVLPNMTLVGSVTNTSYSQSSQRDVDVPFQFTFLAKQIIPQPTTLPTVPVTNSPLLSMPKVDNFLSQSGINGVKLAARSITDLRNTIANPGSTIKDYANSLTGFSKNLGLLKDTNNVSPSITANQIGVDVKGNQATGNSGMFSGVTSALTGIRANLFSPVYGVLTGLTKLIKNVGGDIASVISSFTTPVRDILRDVKSMANQAIGIVNLVNNTINSFANEINGVANDLKSTIATLKKTAGVIQSAPESVAASVKRLVNSGKLLTNAHFLMGSPSRTLPNGSRSHSKMALLNAGPKHTAQAGAKI